MRKAAVALVLLAGLSACAPASTPPTRSPLLSTTPDFARYVGAYRTDAGITWVTNASGQLLNLRDSSFRQLYPTATLDDFTIGPGFTVPTPTQANINFHMNGARADVLTITPSRGQPSTAHRLPFKETEVRIQAHGAVLAGTVTEPVTPGPHPGIVIIHGSEPGQRLYYGVWVGLYASLGMTVLTYDKRGKGASTGTYPGELASEDALNIYADDAAVALRFLAGWPNVDSTRVGFHGGSQGGWTVPLAMQRYHAPAAFAILLSAPAVTVDQQGLWSDFSSGSTVLPSAPPSDMEAQVRAMHGSGYDPRPVLAAVKQPLLWINGAVDRQVPTTINTEILRSYDRADWDIEILPGVDHGLFENPSGLEPDEAKATRLADGIWDKMAAWLVEHAGSLPLR